jgi:hypothetical protein
MEGYDIWGYRDQTWADADLVGFSVEALDGSIGKIDEASTEVGAGYVVVDTGPWIFGKKVLLPAGVIDTIDYDDTTVYVQRTKDEIKNAPELDDDALRDADVRRERYGSYYGRGGAGYYEGTRDYSRPTGTRSGHDPL